jgi:hypothetical protein
VLADHDDGRLFPVKPRDLNTAKEVSLRDGAREGTEPLSSYSWSSLEGVSRASVTDLGYRRVSLIRIAFCPSGAS